MTEPTPTADLGSTEAPAEPGTLPDRPAPEDALARARDVVLDDELEEAGSWMRFFVTTQTTVVVNLSIPAEAPQRYAAANLLLALAHGAVEGAVAAEQDGRRIDVFAAA